MGLAIRDGFSSSCVFNIEMSCYSSLLLSNVFWAFQFVATVLYCILFGEVTETLCAAGRLWVLSPGETYPGREPLCGSGCFPRARHTPGESAF